MGYDLPLISLTISQTFLREFYILDGKCKNAYCLFHPGILICVFAWVILWFSNFESVVSYKLLES